jgi:tRNA (mo5U34)-methyltransferase
MDGLRALDIATFDGFWAFEMERRGADVVAADLAWMSQLDCPERAKQWLMPNPDLRFGKGFALAKELLGSGVERREVSVYDLSPEVVGTFDIVFISDLLQHLRDPQAALEAVYTVVREGGHLILGEPYEADFDLIERRAVREFVAYGDYSWWKSSRAAISLMLFVAGFDPVEEVSRLPEFGVRHKTPKVVFHAHRPNQNDPRSRH